jgi:hypothetical protein
MSEGFIGECMGGSARVFATSGLPTALTSEGTHQGARAQRESAFDTTGISAGETAPAASSSSGSAATSPLPRHCGTRPGRPIAVDYRASASPSLILDLSLVIYRRCSAS